MGRRVWIQQSSALFWENLCSHYFLFISSLVICRSSLFIYHFYLFHLSFQLSQYILYDLGHCDNQTKRHQRRKSFLYLNSLNFRSPNFRAPLKYDLSRTFLFSRNICFNKYFNTVFNEKS